MNNKCSCTKRDKEKCVEESSTGGGKMCFKDPVMTISEDKSREISDRFKTNIKTVLLENVGELTFVPLDPIEYQEYLKNQLTPEKNKLILDNLPDLYEE